MSQVFFFKAEYTVAQCVHALKNDHISSKITGMQPSLINISTFSKTIHYRMKYNLVYRAY